MLDIYDEEKLSCRTGLIQGKFDVEKTLVGRDK